MPFSAGAAERAVWVTWPGGHLGARPEPSLYEQRGRAPAAHGELERALQQGRHQLCQGRRGSGRQETDCRVHPGSEEGSGWGWALSPPGSAAGAAQLGLPEGSRQGTCTAGGCARNGATECTEALGARPMAGLLRESFRRLSSCLEKTQFTTLGHRSSAFETCMFLKCISNKFHKSNILYLLEKLAT